MSDVLTMMQQAGFTGPAHDENVAIAYALSKMTIIDEMEQFDNYQDLLKVEFIELLGRLAERIYEGP